MTKQRFDFFHEAAPPKGAEGWERMYPYYLTPQAEGRDAEDSRFWFADSMHWSRAVHPFDSIGAEAVYLGVGVNSTRSIALPTSLGLDVRVVSGLVYICPLPVTDPTEIGRRAALFGDRAGFYFQNWHDLYARWKEKMLASIAVMKGLDFHPFPEFEPEEVVKKGWGKSASWQVIENYRRLVDEFFLVWQYHFEMLGLGYGAYMVFFQFCKEAFPEIEDQTVARMVAGINGIMFRPDEELRRLAKIGVAAGLGVVLTKEATPEAIFAELATSEAGRAWHADFEATREPWFNYFSEYGFLHDQKTWNDDLSIPLQGIARYAGRLMAGENVDRPFEQLAAEQEELASEYRALLNPAEAQRFDDALNLSRAVFPYIEEHNIYVEHWTHAVFWKKVRELSRMMVAIGFFKDEEDLYYLNRFELDQALADAFQSWAIGVPPRGAAMWQGEIAKRRDIVAALRSVSITPAYGIPPKEVNDPFAVMNYGVTTERVAEWLGATVADGSTFKGIPASPGVAEGPVRIIRHEDEIAQLLPGEILVAPITAPSWASAFSVVSGVVTDIGGMMSHAAIVCREYGMPAVVSTGYASARLKTGQRVRIDGRTGVVEVL
ncbi:PEP-utilizing enzyme [Shinella sp. NM-101]|uniref:PEP-utilizing enzyme n=1 Tax=Shinella sp. NM-101 TaxID=2744455 RepID=UPI001F3ACDDF|nr:PEP-utilizing enzyme [Shinella sp. NM-101]